MKKRQPKRKRRISTSAKRRPTFRRRRSTRKRHVRSRQLQRDRRIQNAVDPLVSVIIPVMNEKRTIAKVIWQAAQVHPLTEVIVIANGSTDGSEMIARRMGAHVFHYPRPLGHDVGRSMGAREAKGKVLLFIDGDFIVSAGELRPFVEGIVSGLDVALNQYSGATQRRVIHNVVLAKHMLNIALRRTDLAGASLTTVPHALSRRAVEAIGIQHIAVPPLAHAIGIAKGLKVRAVHYVNVGPRNPRRRRENGKDPLEKLIIGDHLEAVHWITDKTDKRGNHSDLTRVRDRVR